MPLFDITDEIVSDLGFGTTGSTTVPVVPQNIKWDCSLANLPFLFAFSAQYPMRRETADFRKDRVDNERDPGEQSLDSGFWLRSQASWHYGSGITTAEPLESDATETRFRFARSGGVDPWTPGQLTLLKAAVKEASFTDASPQLLGVGSGVLCGHGTVLTYAEAGSSAPVTWGGAGTIASLTSDGMNYYCADATGVYQGDAPTGVGTLLWNTGGTPLIRWVKNRLMGTVGQSIYELTGTGPTLPTALFTHPIPDWKWTDIADGPSAIYLSGFSGDTSMIYRITVTASDTVVTLSQPIVVAEMPRGESVLSVYSYIGSYLIVGTSKGVRVAGIGSDGSITLGPLSVTTSAGVMDAVADGSYVYVTVGSKGEAGDRVQRGGLYRLDLSTNLNGNPLLFASAADLSAPADGANVAVAEQVTVAGGRVWFACSGTGGGVFYQSDSFVSDGWIETGRIRLATVEPKSWRDLRVMATAGVPGTVTAFASITGAGAPSGWEEIATASEGAPDVRGTLSVGAPSSQQSLFVAFRLHASDTSQSPALIGYQVKAIPAPERTEMVQVPVMLFDFETDRNGSQYGKPGGAWERYSLLKDLEVSGSSVQWLDYTTGERSEAYVERVSLTRTSVPNKTDANAGGIAVILLRLV